MSQGFTESIVEDAALAWLESLGYAVLYGPDIAVGMPGAERSDPNYRDAILEGRLRQALVRLNPDLPSEALEDAFRKLTRTGLGWRVTHGVEIGPGDAPAEATP
jgi:type I restriction enzyme, R subunit